MKTKILSLLLLAFCALAVSAQSAVKSRAGSDVVGTWLYMEEDDDPESVFSEWYFGYEFRSDGTGNFVSIGIANDPSDGINVEVSVDVEVPMTWTKSGNVITMVPSKKEVTCDIEAEVSSGDETTDRQMEQELVKEMSPGLSDMKKTFRSIYPIGKKMTFTISALDQGTMMGVDHDNTMVTLFKLD